MSLLSESENGFFEKRKTVRFIQLGRRFWIAIFVGLLMLGWVIRKAHITLVVGYLRGVSPLWFSGSLLCSIGSYICIGEILRTLIQATKRNFSRTSVYLIAFVSTVVNYIMSVGGISGLTVKVYLLSKKKITVGETLSISMVHSFFTNTIAVFIVIIGCLFTIKQGIVEDGEYTWPVVFLVSASVIFGLGCAAFIVSGRVRELCWLLFRKVVSIIPDSGKIKKFLLKADETFRCFHESMLFLTKSTERLLRTALYALADWILMFGCLYSAFFAVHYHVKLQAVVIGFCAGLMVSLISLIPGGLGIYEGSMVGVFYLMGLDYERSLAAVMIYRFLYFFLPTLLGLLLLGREVVVD